MNGLWTYILYPIILSSYVYIKNEKLFVGNSINREQLDGIGSFFNVVLFQFPNEGFTERKILKVAQKIRKLDIFSVGFCGIFVVI